MDDRFNNMVERTKLIQLKTAFFPFLYFVVVEIQVYLCCSDMKHCFMLKWWTIVQCSGQTEHCRVGKGKQLRLNRVKSCEGKKHGGDSPSKKNIAETLTKENHILN